MTQLIAPTTKRCIYSNHLKMHAVMPVPARQETLLFEACKRSTSHSNARLHNKKEQGLLPCPAGARLIRLHCVTAFAKGLPFPASRALFRRMSQTLKPASSRGLSIYFLACFALLFSLLSHAGSREQAKRIHDRLAGVPPTEATLNTMQGMIDANNAEGAAFEAMKNDAFYSVTLKNWITPWTNEPQTVFAPLNDYTATYIGVVRDDLDIRRVLYDDILYVGNSGAGLPAYSPTNNDHYEQMESRALPLSTTLDAAVPQSSLNPELSAADTAGILTTRASAKAFLIDGTNRALIRFTFMNHLCSDLEPLKDSDRAPDRVSRDVSRSPGGDSRIFLNNCAGCHLGLDALFQAFAYYNYAYNFDNDPEGENGQLVYNSQGETDPQTNSRVMNKYQINSSNFPAGYVTTDDSWINLWRKGANQLVGWDPSLAGSGNGAKSLGRELAHSSKFLQCQVTKVFENVCLRPPVDQNDRDQIQSMVSSLINNQYKLKQTFAESAVYCMGD